jgi:hypothetical protein
MEWNLLIPKGYGVPFAALEHGTTVALVPGDGWDLLAGRP